MSEILSFTALEIGQEIPITCLLLLNELNAQDNIDYEGHTIHCYPTSNPNLIIIAKIQQGRAYRVKVAGDPYDKEYYFSHNDFQSLIDFDLNLSD